MSAYKAAHAWIGLKLCLLVILILGLAACQPASEPKTNATLNSTPVAIPTAAPSSTTAPSATLPAATATQPQPTTTQEPQAISAPRMLKEASITYPSRLIWSLDGKRLAVLGEGGLTLLDAETFEPIVTRSFQSPAFALDFSADGKTLAFSPDGNTIELDDIGSGQSRTLTPGVTFSEATFSPDGRWLAVDSMEEMAYTLWNVASGQKGTVLSGFITAAPVYAADFSPSGDKLIWHARGTIQVMDIASGELAASIGHEDFISAFSLSPDDKLLATAAGGTLNDEFTAIIYLWNPVSGEQIAAYPQAKFASALAFSPDGTILAAGSGADVLLLDPANGQTLQSFHAADDAVSALAFSPDGTRIATANSEGHVRLWRVK